MSPSRLKNDLNEILDVVANLLSHNAPVTEIDYLPGGYSNDNYKICIGSSRYILRICRSVPESVATELAYLDLPIAPSLVNYDRATGHMITEFVDGPLLVKEPFEIEECVQYLRHLHCNIPSGINTHDPVEVALSQLSTANVRNELYQFLVSTSWKPRHPRGCHNDLNPYNIVRIDRSACVTLDWEFAGDNECLFDLVNLCYGLGYSDPDTEECARQYYRMEYDEEFLLQTRLVFQAREHSWALAQAAIGDDRPEIHAQARMARSEFNRIKMMYGY